MRIAVIGSGISGLTTAYLLSSDHEVHLYETERRLGGHTYTLDVKTDRGEAAVDTGFMVFNQRTYPHFCALLNHLGIDSRASDMSFSVSCHQTGLEFEGSSLSGLFAQKRNLFRPRFWGLLADILRFNKHATAWLNAADSRSSQLTLGEFLAQRNYGKWLTEKYLIPMGAAIWSARPETMLDFPAYFILNFYRNHGLLQIADRPIWRTIPGGARRYIEKLTAPLADRVHTSQPARQILRHEDHVVVNFENGQTEIFDHVVLACHSDQALALLADATIAEREVLSVIAYQPNEAVIHTDVTSLPRARAAWASWNYHIPAEGSGSVAVTYDLSRLQGVNSGSPILATLNPVLPIAEEKIIKRIAFAHPAFDSRTPAAQARWSEISGARRTHFCGAYWYHGFHEDGVRSAVAVAKWFGKEWEPCIVASTKAAWNTVVSDR